MQETRKNQTDLKKQSSSPSSKLTTPTNSVPSSPFVARRLKVNQSPVHSVGSEVLKMCLIFPVGVCLLFDYIVACTNCNIYTL